jgi:glycosyltransferase involved in cell wall biosynthesis
MMRVLWFTNTPSLAAEFLSNSSHSGGWIASLQRQFDSVPEIELGIAFHHGYDKEQYFLKGKTHYFTVPFLKDKGKIKGIWSRWRHSIEPESERQFYHKIIDQFKPDLIHIFGSEKSFGLIINEISIPAILQIQGNLTVYTFKWFSGISGLQIMYHGSRKDLLLGYGLFHQFYSFSKKSMREKKILKNCRFIIGRTDWDRRITRVLAPKSKYFHCDEVLRSEFYENHWSFPGNNNSYNISSILSPFTYKGLSTLLIAASLLREDNNFSFEWHIAGINGSEELLSIIEKSHNLKFGDNNIHFKGDIPTDELIPMLLKSSCYVHPSHIENSPNSVCEAMMLGLPVIASFAGGTSSILTNDLEGLLIQDGDPYVLAGAIMELFSQPEKMIYYSKNARQKATLRHKPDAILNKTLDIYKEVLS